MLDEDYLYIGKKSTCKSDKSKFVDIVIIDFFKFEGSSRIFSCADEDEIKEFIYEAGTLAPLQTYTSDVLDASSTNCPVCGINHLF